MTPADLLAAALRRDPGRPLVTWYDDASGERVELSVATAANWAAKTANLLVDDYGAGAGDAVRLRPAAHWLTPVVALGAWTAGVAVADRDDAEPLPGDPQEFMAAVLPQPDALTAPPPAPDDPALELAGRSWTLAELGAAATHAVGEHGLATGCRVLSVLPLDTVDGIDAGLLVPLAAGGSVVLVTNADTAKLESRAETERATHTAGVGVAGLPRLC